VTVVSAPPGSGKTVLLRSWISQAGLAERAAWVPAGRDERDPQRLWLSVLGALRQTALVRLGETERAEQVLAGQAFLLEAIARDALGDQAAAGRALERALDLAEPDGALLWFLLHPAPGLLERNARQGTAHAALIARILDLLAGPGG
jgi:hypothetical protein